MAREGGRAVGPQGRPDGARTSRPRPRTAPGWARRHRRAAAAHRHPEGLRPARRAAAPAGRRAAGARRDVRAGPVRAAGHGAARGRAGGDAVAVHRGRGRLVPAAGRPGRRPGCSARRASGCTARWPAWSRRPSWPGARPGSAWSPVQDPARLVVAPDGTVTVVGVPMPAKAKAPPVPRRPATGRHPARRRRRLRPTPPARRPTDQEAPVPAAGRRRADRRAAAAGAAGADAAGDPAADGRRRHGDGRRRRTAGHRRTARRSAPAPAGKVPARTATAPAPPSPPAPAPAPVRRQRRAEQQPARHSDTAGTGPGRPPAPRRRRRPPPGTG